MPAKILVQEDLSAGIFGILAKFLRDLPIYALTDGRHPARCDFSVLPYTILLFSFTIRLILNANSVCRVYPL